MSFRWARVNEYLQSFGFRPQVGENDFLPENMVYRLGFKAINEYLQSFGFPQNVGENHLSQHLAKNQILLKKESLL